MRSLIGSYRLIGCRESLINRTPARVAPPEFTRDEGDEPAARASRGGVAFRETLSAIRLSRPQIHCAICLLGSVRGNVPARWKPPRRRTLAGGRAYPSRGESRYERAKRQRGGGRPCLGGATLQHATRSGTAAGSASDAGVAFAGIHSRRGVHRCGMPGGSRGGRWGGETAAAERRDRLMSHGTDCGEMSVAVNADHPRYGIAALRGLESRGGGGGVGGLEGDSGGFPQRAGAHCGE